MNSTLDLTTRFYGRPVLVDESFARHLQQASGQPLLFNVPENADTVYDLPQSIHTPNIALIPVTGTLINGFDYSFYGATGYDFINNAIAEAEADASVDGVAFMIDSHGGEVAGCFECADTINAMTKPTVAVVGSYAHSAAYALASATDNIFVTRSGSVGSIGVVTMHVDVSKALDSYGVKPTLIYAGKHKVDGNPFGPLPADVKSDIQGRVDKLYSQFVNTVAANRGLSYAAVQGTEAQTYDADDALTTGLADSINAPTDALADFSKRLSTGVNTMSTQANDTEAIRLEAVKAERTRIYGIISCEAAEGRTELAAHLAFQTDQTVEQATALLQAAPKAEAPTVKGNAFELVMDNSDNPNVGGNETADQVAEQVSFADSVFNAFDAATGREIH